MPDLEQEGGNNAEMYQAGGAQHIDKSTHHYYSSADDEDKDLGRINEIFEFIIKNVTEKQPLRDQSHIKITEKIALNFKDESERGRVIEYFKYAYTKLASIQNRIELEDTDTQSDLAGDIFERYNKFKDCGTENIVILESLFSHYCIPEKKNDPSYTSLARAYVLFFFDDCTIFEKTESEK